MKTESGLNFRPFKIHVAGLLARLEQNDRWAIRAIEILSGAENLTIEEIKERLKQMLAAGITEL